MSTPSTTFLSAASTIPTIRRSTSTAAGVTALAVFLFTASAAIGQSVDVTPNGPVHRCTGQSITFTATATGFAPTGYQWTKNGSNITGETSSTYTIASVALSDAGNYNCVVDPGGVQDATDTALVVDEPAQISTQPADAVACVGTTVSFAASATGTPTLSYQWQRGPAFTNISDGPTGNGSTYSGTSTNTLSIANVQSADAGTFRLVVSNTCGTGTFFDFSTPATLAADSAAPTFRNCPTNITQGTDAGFCSASVTWTVPTPADDCPIVSSTQSHTPPATFPVGTTTVTYTATDTSGQTGTCTFTVTVVDDDAPAITCPASLTVSCGANTTPAATGEATATDNCTATPSILITFADSTAPGSCPQESVITRTWTATDTASPPNSSSCIQTITVDDSVAPVIMCPASLTINCGESTLPANTGSATATDDCDTTPTVSHSDTTLGTCPEVITRTWTATDDCLNSSSCVQTITVQDVTAPVITCPANTTVQCNTSTAPGVTGSATATDTCDASPTITSSDVNSLGGCNGTGTITRTWTATDDCSNSSSCVQTITVVDTTPPSLTVPANANRECGENTAPPPGFNNTGVATATDNCDATPTITFIDVVTTGTCPVAHTITRTWTATDDCGQSSSGVQTITVFDTTPPVITCPANITIPCTTDPNPGNTGSASAVDLCDPVRSVTFSDSSAAGPCAHEQTITRTWTAVDDCNNSASCAQTITVEDNTGPAMTCPAAASFQCAADVPAADFAGHGGTASDDCGGAVIVAHVGDTNNGGTGCPGNPLIITRTYSATDVCLNTSTCTQTITVEDNTPPVLTCPSAVGVQCISQVPANDFAGGSATDNCLGLVSVGPGVDTTNGGSGCTASPLIITRTYTGMDSCGNTATCTQTITVIDTTPPIITGFPLDQTVQCPGDVPAPNTALVTASDNCGGTVTVTHQGDVTAGSNPAVLTRTYRATDACGNFVEQSQTFTIQDTTDPTVTCSSTVTTMAADGTCQAQVPDLTGLISGTDNCTGPLVASQSPLSGTLVGLGTHTVILTLTDGANNSASCNVTLQVTDQTPPVVTCPLDASRGRLDPTDPYSTGTATATDNCPPAPAITWNDDRSGLTGCNATGTIVRTWTATDGAGLTHTCNQTITITDTTSPVVTCPSNISTITDPGVCDAAVAYPAATGTDLGYHESFEDPAYASGTFPNQPSVSWNNYNSHVTRVPSGTNGVPSSHGSAHATIDSTVPLPAPPNDFTGAFTRQGGYSPVFGNGFSSFFDIFIDVTAPDIAGATPTTGYGWDLSAAVNNPSNGHRRDFIFHAAAYGPGGPPGSNGGVVIGGSNNSGFTRRNDLLSINHAILTTTGWYTFEWRCRDDGSGILAVDLIVRDSLGTQLFIETRTDPSDIIGPPAIGTPVVGGNRYVWFTFLETPLIHVDNSRLIRNVPASCLPAAPGPFAKGTTSVTCSGTDACGNPASCNFSITVIDTEAPVISCPPTADIECSASAAPANPVPGFATATDNCDPITPTFADGPTTASGPCPVVASFTRTWTAMDTSSNSSSCSQLIRYVDTTPPVLTRPPDITIECGVVGTSPAETGGPATATDTCDPSPDITYTDITAQGVCPTVTIVTRTWTATDDCGNTNSGIQVITVQDTTNPSITCPADITVNCIGDVPAANPAALPASDLCDPTVTKAHVGDTNNGGSGCLASPLIISRTYSATDDCGHTAFCVQTITVQDTTPPTVVCPSDVTVACPSQVPAADFAGGTSSDNCGGTVIVVFELDTSNGGAGCPGNPLIISRLYRGTDTCGNSSTCTQTITVVDNVLPVLACPADITVECLALVPAPNFAGGSASDNCGGAVTVGPGSDTNNGGTGCTASPLIITRTYTGTDSCGNSASCVQTITVVDTTAPVLTCPADTTVECPADIPLANFAGGSASDNCGGPVTVGSSDVVTGTGCISSSMVVTRTYTGVDSCGNAGTCVQTITVIDTIAPVATSSGPIGNCYGSVALAEAAALANSSATDNCTASPSPTVVTTGNDCLRTITVTYADACGNMSNTLTYTTSTDTTPPVATSSGPINSCYETIALAEAAALANSSATDNCAASPTASVSNLGTDCFRFITVTYTDGCGNISNALLYATQTDNTDPVITFCPPSVTIDCSASTDPSNTGTATATDNCAATVTYSDQVFAQSCSAGIVGGITRTWTATDACGNTASCVQGITLQDTTDPVITCPADLTVECSDSTAPTSTGTATATDDCSGVTVGFTDVQTAGSCPNQYSIARTWRAEDGCGNDAECVQTITVVDTTPPVITCPSNIATGTDPGLCSAVVTFAATATDNCAAAPIITYSDASGSAFPTGTTTVTATASDGCGNSSSCTFTVTVTDDEPPVVTCSGDVYASFGPGSCDGIVTFGPPTVTDNCPGPYTASCSPPSGSVFTNGSTLVTCTAMDASGLTSICTFTVTVATDWKPAVNYAVGTDPVAVILADMGTAPGNPTPDTFLDIVTADQASGTITVRYNDGLGGFGLPPVPVPWFAYGPGEVPTALAAGDFDGLNGTDLAVAIQNSGGPHRVSILANGAVPIEIVQLQLVSVNPISVKAGQLDGMGVWDVAVACTGTVPPFNDSGIHVHLNPVAGPPILVGPSLPYPVGTQPKDVSLCDLDNDLDLDLAAAAQGGSSTVLLYDNTAGAFASAGALAGPNVPLVTASRLCCGDLDGDQRDNDLGLLSAGFGVNGRLSLFINTGAVGSLSPASFNPRVDFTTGTGSSALACGDIQSNTVHGNFPGDPALRCDEDVVVADSSLGGFFRQFLGYDCGSTFRNTHDCFDPTSPSDISLGDLNGDGMLDLVISDISTDSVIVLCAVVRALGDQYGTPCPGTNPQIDMPTLPVHGFTADVRLFNAMVGAPAILAVSASVFQTPIGGGCNVYLGLPIFILTSPPVVVNGAGEAHFFFPVPVAMFTGDSLYFQWAVFDGAPSLGLSLTQGLHARVGY